MGMIYIYCHKPIPNKLSNHVSKVTLQIETSHYPYLRGPPSRFCQRLRPRNITKLYVLPPQPTPKQKQTSVRNILGNWELGTHFSLPYSLAYPYNILRLNV